MKEKNLETIQKFYDAFAQRDAQGMIACYHQDLIFEDPAFGQLDYEHACAMWQMLTISGKDLSIALKDAWADDLLGTAHWEADYSFSKTGRKVRNQISASFSFKHGLIVRHKDQFDFYKWTRMALGISGILLGWTDFFQKKVRNGALQKLHQFMAK